MAIGNDGKRRDLINDISVCFVHRSFEPILSGLKMLHLIIASSLAGVSPPRPFPDVTQSWNTDC